jgi:D-3-phosphoglycerate dehydrogenase
MNLKALNCALIAGRDEGQEPGREHGLRPDHRARKRASSSPTTTQDKTGVFDGYIKLTVKTDAQDPVHRGHGVLGRQAALHPDQGHQHRRRDRASTCSTPPTTDVPGIIGFAGQTMGENGVNIANFTGLGREKGGDAIALLYVDDRLQCA